MEPSELEQLAPAYVLTRGSNIDLAGCGIRLKMMAGVDLLILHFDREDAG